MMSEVIAGIFQEKLSTGNEYEMSSAKCGSSRLVLAVIIHPRDIYWFNRNEANYFDSNLRFRTSKHATNSKQPILFNQ